MVLKQKRGYTQAAKINKSGAEPYLSLANLHAKQNEFRQSAEYFKKALSRTEFSPLDYYRYLETLQQAGDEYKQQFIRILKQALSKYPNDTRLNQLLDQFAQKVTSPRR